MGSVRGDSHLVLPEDKREFSAIEAHDMQPFVTLAKQLDGIMPAHIRYTLVDDHPAGFSSYWLQNVLRQQLGFDGVIFSDDLSMEGACGVGGYTERADLALEAGCDMVLVCNNREGAIEVVEYLSKRSFSTDSERRLRAMLARKSWDRLNLKRDKRWYQAIGMVDQLMKVES